MLLLLLLARDDDVATRLARIVRWRKGERELEEEKKVGFFRSELWLDTSFRFFLFPRVTLVALLFYYALLPLTTSNQSRRFLRDVSYVHARFRAAHGHRDDDYAVASAIDQSAVAAVATRLFSFCSSLACTFDLASPFAGHRRSGCRRRQGERESVKEKNQGGKKRDKT